MLKKTRTSYKAFATKYWTDTDGLLSPPLLSLFEEVLSAATVFCTISTFQFKKNTSLKQQQRKKILCRRRNRRKIVRKIGKTDRSMQVIATTSVPMAKPTRTTGTKKKQNSALTCAFLTANSFLIFLTELFTQSGFFRTAKKCSIPKLLSKGDKIKLLASIAIINASWAIVIKMISNRYLNYGRISRVHVHANTAQTLLVLKVPENLPLLFEVVKRNVPVLEDTIKTLD